MSLSKTLPIPKSWADNHGNHYKPYNQINQYNYMYYTNLLIQSTCTCVYNQSNNTTCTCIFSYHVYQLHHWCLYLLSSVKKWFTNLNASNRIILLDGLTINIITIQICMSRYQACSQGGYIGFGQTPLLETNGEIIKHVSAWAYTVHAWAVVFLWFGFVIIMARKRQSSSQLELLKNILKRSDQESVNGHLQ